MHLTTTTKKQPLTPPKKQNPTHLTAGMHHMTIVAAACRKKSPAPSRSMFQ